MRHVTSSILCVSGHRQGGRGPTTPRRASVTGLAQSQPNTPRIQRKLSMTSPLEYQSQTSNIRSASPGPNSKKLPLSRTYSQDSSVTSPGTVSKTPNFSKSGTNLKNSVSNVSVSKSKQSNQPLNTQPGVKSGSVSGPVNQRRSASPAPGVKRSQSPAPLVKRSQSPAPGVKRSQSPAPEAINRLRSPSPLPSSSKSTNGARTQSVPASVAKRCASPVKQITLSDVR